MSLSLSLRFDIGLQIYIGSYDGIQGDKDILCVIKEKIYPMENYGFLEAIRLKQGTLFTSFRSFMGDLKVEAYVIDDLEGLVKIDENILSLDSKNVRVDLLPDSINDSKVWCEQLIEFSNKHRCKVFVSIKNNIYLDYLKSLFGRSGLEFLDYSDNCSLDSYLQIGRSDIDSNGIRLTGCPQIYQDLSCGWILQSGWRYYRSFKNPRDWHQLENYEIARDVLGLSEIRNPRSGYPGYDKWKDRKVLYFESFLKEGFWSGDK